MVTWTKNYTWHSQLVLLYPVEKEKSASSTENGLNIKFHGFLIKFGFIRSSADPCVYIKKEEDCLTIIAIWVDDGLICGSDIKRLDSVVKYLSQNFEMTCETVDCFVGIQIVQREKPFICNKKITLPVC